MDQQYLVKAIEPIKNKMVLILEGSDDELQVVVAQECFYTNLVKVDQVVERGYLDKIKACDLYYQIMEKAFGYIKKKDYSTVSLKKQLLSKFKEESAIDEVISQIQKMNYLNDYKFMETFIENALLKRHGSIRILDGLKEHGIDDATNLVKEILKDKEFENGVAEARTYLKKNNKKDNTKVKRGIYTRLNYLGYEPELIEKIFKSLKISLNEDQD